MKIFVDTSVVLRYASVEDSKHEVALNCVLDLLEANHELMYTSQVERESWAVMTRPLESNGFGLDIPEAKALMRSIENVMSLLEDSPEVHKLWRDLVERYDVKGKQVHDANHVAAVLANGIDEVLTLDERDFRRYREIRVRIPQ